MIIYHQEVGIKKKYNIFFINIYMDYKEKYIKYKKKYINLLTQIEFNNKNVLNGGKYNKNKQLKYDYKKINIYESLLFNDLIEINKNLLLQYSKENLIKKENKQNKNYEQNKRTISRITKHINKSEVFSLTDVKYDLPIELSGKYLEKYNKIINNMTLSIDLYKSGFYEYIFKLKQYLTNCGINRTTQLYGTCWFNSTINGIIFSSKMKGRYIQLLLYYINLISENEFKKIINNINKNKYKLIQNIDKNQENIFYHIITLLYTILCQEGLRNKNPTKYENFSLTNLAINIKNIYNESNTKKINIKNINNIAFIPIYGINFMTFIFNKFIDNNHHIMVYDNPINKIYSFHNTNHINILYFDDINDNIKLHLGFEYNNIFIKNVIIDINNNGIKKTYNFTEGNNIDSLYNSFYIQDLI